MHILTKILEAVMAVMVEAVYRSTYNSTIQYLLTAWRHCWNQTAITCVRYTLSRASSINEVLRQLRETGFADLENDHKKVGISLVVAKFNYQLPTSELPSSANYQLANQRTTNYQLPTANCKLPTTNYQLRTNNSQECTRREECRTTDTFTQKLCTNNMTRT